MSRPYWMIATLCGVLVLSCSKSAILRKYYVLEAHALVDTTMVGQTPTLLIKVDIRDFSVAKAFDQTRIAVRTNTNELNYYYYHLWAVRPATAIADVVYERTNRMHLFQRCMRGFSVGPDYYISGQIMALERTQKGKKESAHLQGTITLYDARTELPVMEQPFDRTLELKENSMNAFAGVCSSILENETGIFLSSLIDHFNKNKQ
jgi:ABC-type uncharacterized transport system auxiliary subunit